MWPNNFHEKKYLDAAKTKPLLVLLDGHFQYYTDVVYTGSILSYKYNFKFCGPFKIQNPVLRFIWLFHWL